MYLGKSSPKSGENTWLWLIKIISGLLIIVILIVHFIVNHFIAEGSLMTYSDIAVYYSNPLIPLMEIAFLVFVVTHALLGLRSIILDLHPSRAVLGAVNWVFTIVGLASIVYGIWLIQVIVSRGSGG
jgi:succinate dehydrogenase / fumarate reductase membrane anchor subunit